MLFQNKSQIWVETAIYTLIGLTIIAILLSVAIPQIEKTKDRGILRQTYDALNVLDNKVSEVADSGLGNGRVVNLRIAKGKLKIDSNNDKIVYTLENTRLEASEPDIEIKEGNIILKTEKYGSRFKITLTRDYKSSLDINYGNREEKTLTAAQMPYKIYIENLGSETLDEKIKIEFSVF